MFLSLDRVDVQAELADGRLLWVQTDHREQEEVAANAALSTIAALVRCLNARRHSAEGAVTVVAYNARAEPPAFLRAAVEAASGLVWVGQDAAFVKQPFVPGPVDTATVNRLVNEAMDGLAEDVRARRGGFAPLSTLRAYEAELVSNGFPDEENEGPFWTVILELAALTAKAIQPTNGGTWRYAPTTTGTLPFTFECTFNQGPATVNPLGKALKFLRAKGGGDDPSALVQMLAGAA